MIFTVQTKAEMKGQMLKKEQESSKSTSVHDTQFNNTHKKEGSLGRGIYNSSRTRKYRNMKIRQKKIKG